MKAGSSLAQLLSAQYWSAKAGRRASSSDAARKGRKLSRAAANPLLRTLPTSILSCGGPLAIAPSPLRLGASLAQRANSVQSQRLARGTRPCLECAARGKCLNVRKAARCAGAERRRRLRRGAPPAARRLRHPVGPALGPAAGAAAAGDRFRRFAAFPPEPVLGRGRGDRPVPGLSDRPAAPGRGMAAPAPGRGGRGGRGGLAPGGRRGAL